MNMEKKKVLKEVDAWYRGLGDLRTLSVKDILLACLIPLALLGFGIALVLLS